MGIFRIGERTQREAERTQAQTLKSKNYSLMGKRTVGLEILIKDPEVLCSLPTKKSSEHSGQWLPLKEVTLGLGFSDDEYELVVQDNDKCQLVLSCEW